MAIEIVIAIINQDRTTNSHKLASGGYPACVADLASIRTSDLDTCLVLETCHMLMFKVDFSSALEQFGPDVT